MGLFDFLKSKKETVGENEYVRFVYLIESLYQMSFSGAAPDHFIKENMNTRYYT